MNLNEYTTGAIGNEFKRRVTPRNYVLYRQLMDEIVLAIKEQNNLFEDEKKQHTNRKAAK